MKRSYHGFTIVELLGAIIIISVALLSILGLLRVAITYTNKTRQETIAINLAREGIEGVYNRRNTNWLRQSGEKDKNWLNIDNEVGGSAKRFQGSGALYKLRYLSTEYGKLSTFEPEGRLTNDSILGDTSLLLSSSDFIGGTSPDAAGRFYRAIIGLGLYLKDSTTLGGDIITCDNGDGLYNTSDYCSNSQAKEYRFCSRVEYEKDLKGSVELCGSITNYQE